ncbi:hypothetical protein JCM9533A_09900 [Catenuloplanes niger JCM 9533]
MAASATAGNRTVLLTRSGIRVLLRNAGAGDLESVNELHARCSVRSREGRYLRRRETLRVSEWQRLVDRRHGLCQVAFVSRAEDRPIGYATLTPTGRPGDWEASVLIEDLWQNKGVGTAVAGRLIDLAAENGVRFVITHVAVGNRPALWLFRRLGAEVTVRHDLVEARVAVAGPRGRTTPAPR